MKLLHEAVDVVLEAHERLADDAADEGTGMARMWHGTLEVGTVESVNVGRGHRSVEVLNRSDAEIWFTLDGSDPTEEGADTWVLPARAARELPRRFAGETEVRLLAASAAACSVTGLG